MVGLCHALFGLSVFQRGLPDGVFQSVVAALDCSSCFSLVLDGSSQQWVARGKSESARA